MGGLQLGLAPVDGPTLQGRADEAAKLGPALQPAALPDLGIFDRARAGRGRLVVALGRDGGPPAGLDRLGLRLQRGYFRALVFRERVLPGQLAEPLADLAAPQLEA